MNQLWVYILMVFFLQWVIQLAYLQKHYEISPQVKIIFFILFYIYIVLHSHVKSYKYIHFYIYFVFSNHVKLDKYVYFTLAQSVNKFHYGIYTYTECKFQTLTWTTLLYTYVWAVFITYLLATHKQVVIGRQKKM